ncbi:MAG: efflux transporter outer membrane subunit [Burkholderiales bacterium]|jgi:NodT family efflux transporter outer membrane factor (OMF) lipoprotein
MTRRPLIRVLCIVLATPLAACNVGPDYERPSAVVTPVYKESGEWKTATPVDQFPRGEWWRIYGDADLDRLETDATQTNQTIAIAEANYREAKTLVDQARAGLFPAVGLGVAASRGNNTSVATSSVRNSTSASIDATWEIDLWGHVRRAVEASEANATASAADLESARLSIQAQLAIAYFTLRVSDSGQRLLDRTVDAYQQSLTLTTNRYNAGVVARADVVQAQTQLKSAQAQAVDNRATRAQFEHAIAVLTGRAPAQFSLAVANDLPVPSDVPPGVPSQLLERRPDIAAAERRMAAANAQIGVATAAFYPTISLSASGGAASSDLAHLLSLSNRFWSVGANLAEPLFDAGLRRAQRDQTIAQYDAAVANYRQTVLGGFQEVEDNLSTLAVLKDEATIQSQAVDAARLALELVTNQYKAGIVDFLNVVAAQTVLFNNERTLVLLRGRQWQANVTLVKALGGGWSTAELASAAK